MVARCQTSVIEGVQARTITVEAVVSAGLPGTTLVGLVDTAVRESRERVRTAFDHAGLDWPRTKITVALLPASIPKRGSGFDAAIAVSILAAQGQVPPEVASATCVLGELGLDGRLHPVSGVIAAALALRESGLRLLVPVACVGQAALVAGVQVGGVRDLVHLVRVLRGEAVPEDGERVPPVASRVPDLSDVRGQSEARRALEICAAGGHHLAMVGVPGVGKTLLAERLPGLLPALDDEAALEVTSIWSIAGHDRGGVQRHAPFQAPHHTASAAAVLGGGQGGRLRVGSATLAHRGVLFLDEAPEFSRLVLDGLREPLESGEVRLARADAQATLPARFNLVLAANPCPCGHGVGMEAHCSCSPLQRRRYATKLSGPVLDRIDCRVSLERPSLSELGENPEGSADVAQRVGVARERAAARWSGAGIPWRLNAEVPGPWLRRHHPADEAGTRILRTALSRTSLSLRGADRVLRVAWTLADLGGADRPGSDHVSTAMVMRGTEGPWAA
jgi:magnesium chelatase family protein